MLQGTPVVGGVVFAPVQRVGSEVDADAISRFRQLPPQDPDSALSRYDAAIDQVVSSFLARSEKANGSAAEVLAASASLAKDKGLRSQVRKNLLGDSVLLDAVDAAVEHFTTVFAAMGGLMAERVTDLRDIGLRAKAHIVGAPEPGIPTPDVPSVLVAEDLSPADSAGLDPSLVIALVMEKGGSTSHTAIIARQMGIPCIVGTVGALQLPNGALVLVDGTAGTVELDADPEQARRRVEESRKAKEALDRWTGPAITSDGHAVKLLANVADPDSAELAAQGPVEGVGLFRTELSFLSSTQEPSVEEQAELYAGVLRPFAPDRYVVTRTLDAGSDKPIAYATIPGEENPALGVRGLRLSFGKPGLLERQLDALALAGQRTGTQPWVMAPMVATADEAADFADKVRARGMKPGVMVEIPSAALLAWQLLEHVDFLSIGTNDLTQYTMAADRMATDLSHLTDPWQPAVLHLVAITAAAGKQVDKPVGVCGEAAADPLLACVLVGMGITSLSMASASVRAVGAQLSQVTHQQCRYAAEAATAAKDPAAARAAVREVLAVQ